VDYNATKEGLVDFSFSADGHRLAVLSFPYQEEQSDDGV
jgi:hypothetical protein